VRWHWHTPNEHLMLVSGRARQECVMYVHSDGPFDIHYVDN
jgi:hypothetical protein